MKKLFCSVITFICVMSMLSCGNNEYGILFYQDNKVTAECTVNDKYNVIIISDGDSRSLEIVTPKELEETRFEFSADGCYAISDNIKIPLDRNDLKGIFALVSIFSLEEGHISSAKVKGEQSISFDTPMGIYKMSFDERGYPKNAEITDGSYNFNVKINTLKLEDRSK